MQDNLKAFLNSSEYKKIIEDPCTVAIIISGSRAVKLNLLNSDYDIAVFTTKATSIHDEMLNSGVKGIYSLHFAYVHLPLDYDFYKKCFDNHTKLIYGAVVDSYIDDSTLLYVNNINYSYWQNYFNNIINYRKKFAYLYLYYNSNFLNNFIMMPNNLIINNNLKLLWHLLVCYYAYNNIEIDKDFIMHIRSCTARKLASEIDTINKIKDIFKEIIKIVEENN